jgi:hypothetical protein
VAARRQRILVAVAAPERQRILVAGSRIQVQEHRMPVGAECPITQAWVSTISAITMLRPEDTLFTHNMG